MKTSILRFETHEICRNGIEKASRDMLGLDTYRCIQYDSSQCWSIDFPSDDDASKLQVDGARSRDF